MTERFLLAGFAQQVVLRPNAPALTWRDQTFTYRQLDVMAAAARTAVLAGGEGGEPVCLLVRKSPAAVALILGTLMAGRRCLLPPAGLPSATVEALMARAGCRRVLTTDRAIRTGHVTLPVELVGLGATTGTSSVMRSPAPAGDGVGFMLTTSGSTGLPKIVPLPDVGVARFIAWAGPRFKLRPGSLALNYAPLNFDLCLLDVWASLAHGGCVVLVDQDQAANPAYLLGLLAVNDVTMIQAVPLFYRLLLEAVGARGRRFEAVEHVAFTGDSLPAVSLAALPRLFPRAKLFNIYGCTETNDSFICEVSRADAAGLKRVPIGEPLPGVRTLVVDREGKPQKGVGGGELLVATPFQTEGYAGGVTASPFVTFDDGDGPRSYFRTGDLVERHADGTLTLEGRIDFHVKVRGVRVNAQEVERVILQHDDVLEGAVMVLPDPTAGHRLHALVRRRRHSKLNSLLLFQHCARRLARGAVPTSITIVDQVLPKTSTGKVDRRLIVQTHLEEASHAL